MKKTHCTAVVIIPPEHIWPPVQSIRERHDSKIRRWMPHITLVYPFVPVGDFPVMANLLAAACDDVEPFEITLSTFDSFTHAKGRCTIWLKPAPEKPLLDLCAVVREAVSHYGDFESRSRRFTPHLSVGQVRGRRQRDDLLAELKRQWKPVSFQVEAIQMIAREDPPDDVFEIMKTVELGKTKS